MVLLAPLIAGFGVALFRGGSLKHLADLPLRLGWLAVLCLIAQLCVSYYPVDRLEVDRPLQAVLLVGSYGLLLLVVWSNRRIWGMAVLALGLALNLAVIAANGGFMPVSRDALVTAGIRPAVELLSEGQRLPRSKDILLAPEQTRLQLLSDAIVGPGIQTAKVYSVGDLAICLGAFLVLQAAMVPNKRIENREEVHASVA